MSIPITCTVCRASIKVPEGITEQKKIRCSGCSTIILLTPDPSNPGSVTASYPRKSEKKKEFTEAQKRLVLYGVFGVMCIFLAYAFWWSNKTPADRGAVQGTVTLDGSPMETGTVIFESLDGKGIKSTISVSLGKYEISARNGPGLGLNKVMIHSYQKTGVKVDNPAKPGEEIDQVKDVVAPRYNNEEMKKIEIKEGVNSLNLEVLSK